MDVIRFTHSCLRAERFGQALVVDPGIWSEPEALSGADAVLVTHEHVDHVDELRLAELGVPVFAPAGAKLHRLTPVRVRPGQTFTAAGFTVVAEGGRHARVVPSQNPCANLGYRIEHELYHPGDSLDLPTGPVRLLFVPMQASWLKTSEAVDFVRAVGPQRAVGMHDGQVNDRGRDSLNSWLGRECGPCYTWSAPGTCVPTSSGA